MLAPNKIYGEFERNIINKLTALNLLVTIIENSDNDNVREDCIYYLQKLGIENKMFEFFENLFISDSSARIRNASAKIINLFFLNKALKPMKYALKEEKDYDCFITVIETLVKLNNWNSKSILKKELKKIKKEKYLDKTKGIDNKKHKKSIDDFFKKTEIDKLNHSELAEIIVNYKTICCLTRKFYSVSYDLENALVVKLDLADIEYEVRGWKSEFKNNIKSVSEITGLKNLKKLRELNVSNNLIENFKDLIDLKELTHLYISNNKIKDDINLEYLKRLNLKYLDISGNELCNIIKFEDFPNLRIKVNRFYC